MCTDKTCRYLGTVTSEGDAVGDEAIFEYSCGRVGGQPDCKYHIRAIHLPPPLSPRHEMSEDRIWLMGDDGATKNQRIMQVDRR